MKPPSHKILLVEDDAMIASGLVYALEQEGYDVCHAACVTDARQVIDDADEDFDLAILDMQLPDGTGIDVQQILIDTSSSVLFLSVVDDEGNIVRAFEAGAADYVTKPFRLRELTARIKRILNTADSLKNNRDSHDDEKIVLNNLLVDTYSGKVFVHGQRIELTALEYKVLLALVNNVGRLLTRSQILDIIWEDAGGFVEDNTLTVYIKRLREKCKGEIDIETVRGIGYRVN